MTGLVGRSRAADLEGELVVADLDPVTVGKVSRGLDPLPLDLDTVGRPQIDDHEAGSRVHDRGMVAADVGVVEDDFVVVVSPDPGCGGTQPMELSRSVSQSGSGGISVGCAAALISGLSDGGVLCGPFGVEWLLTQDSLVSALIVGPGSMPSSSANEVFSRR